jgi:cytoskeletal protein CcmA (bactofilin family)
MFGRGSSSDNKMPEPLKPANPLPSFAAMAQPVPAPAAPSPFAAATELTASVIGTDLTILGEKITIISKHQLQIDGDVRGDVNGRKVTIGPEGSVIGTVSAETVEVRGGVRGAIRGQSVVLHPTAKVEGDITHGSLAISEGAEFDGRVRRAKDMAEVTPQLDPAAFAPSAAAQG